ncbi:MAG: hypothetical protein M1832_005911 [Thelocarpon impressellum]|nr:MAG: hypothetical protein M1832_005911 [Thelocarpon impressellum]
MDDGIHGDVGDPRPANWDEISQRLARRRPSVSGPAFSDEAYKRFADAVETSLSEQMVMMALSSVLSGTAQKPCTGDVRFDNLEQLTSQKLSPARPDLYDGANMMVIDLQVRRELDKYIIPSIRHPAPVLPNFFMEGKGPDGAPAVGQLQARYNGALGARGMRAIQGFGTDCKTHYDGEAYTLTSDFHPFFGGLRIYSVHPVRPKEAGARPEYHMSCIGSWALTVSAQQFRDGICAIRNARDWAKEQRDDAIRAANARVGGGGAGVTPAESVAGSVAGSGRTRRSERS